MINENNNLHFNDEEIYEHIKHKSPSSLSRFGIHVFLH